MARNKIASSRPFSSKRKDLQQLRVPRDQAQESGRLAVSQPRLYPGKSSVTGEGHSTDRARSAKSKPRVLYFSGVTSSGGLKLRMLLSWSKCVHNAKKPLSDSQSLMFNLLGALGSLFFPSRVLDLLLSRQNNKRVFGLGAFCCCLPRSDKKRAYF